MPERMLPATDPAVHGRELLDLALARPQEALAAAQALLHAGAEPVARTYAWHAVAVVARDRDDVRGAVSAARAALRTAERYGLDERARDVRGTLGTALVLAGQPAEALRAFDAALVGARGFAAARTRMLRAAVLEQVRGDSDAVAADYAAALATFRRLGEDVWEARTLLNRAESRWRRGHLDAADADLRRAEAVLLEAGDAADAANARGNRAWLAQVRGDLPGALRHITRAEALYAVAGESASALVAAFRSRVWLAAGLYSEALASAEEGLQRVGPDDAARQAELRRDAAAAALLAGQPGRAADLAREAQRSFGRTGNPGERAHALLLELRARRAGGEEAGRLLRRARALADAARLDADAATDAHLLAGELAIDAGQVAVGRAHLRAAASRRRRGTALLRTRGWLAAALDAEASGRSRRVLDACGHGLDVLDEHLGTLGAAEIRAASTVHGAGLARLGLRHALALDDPRLVLGWSERWRGTLLDTEPPGPDTWHDADQVARLAQLRRTVSQLRAAAASGRPTGALRRERAALERAVREAAQLRSGVRGRAAAGGGADGDGGDGGSAQRRTAAGGPGLDDLPDRLGDAALLMLAGLDDQVHVVRVHAGEVSVHRTGGVDEAVEATDRVLFPLRAVAGGGPTAAHMLEPLHAALDALDDVLLGDALAGVDAERVVVVPPSRLHSLPWDALPVLRDRTVCVAPSATSWLAARATTPPRQRRTVLVGAPGLAQGEVEVRALAEVHPRSTVLQGQAASTDAVLGALDGAWLGHVAAHGTFRGDNPLFSALEMADGPLTVYDLERLRRPPYRLVLSACESGVERPTGADELLGVASALVRSGTAGLLASVVPVDDDATARLSIEVHQRLAAGDDLPAALAHARARACDPVDIGIAYAFLALGAV